MSALPYSVSSHGSSTIGLILAITIVASLVTSTTIRGAQADDAWSVGSQLSSIRADSDNVYILWQNNSPDQNIYFKKSTDHGNTFGKTVKISNISQDPDSGFGLAANALMAVPAQEDANSDGDSANNNYVYIAWLNRDQGAPHSTVSFRASPDGGNTFSDPISLTDSDFKGDSGIQQLFASGNNVYAVLINEWAAADVNDYYYDLILRVSADNGRTFGSPVHLIPNLPTRNVRAGLSISVSPLQFDSGGELGSDGGGGHDSSNNTHNDAIYMAWIDYGSCTVEQVNCKDIKVLFRKSTDNGKTFSNPVEIKRPRTVFDHGDGENLRSLEPMYLQVASSSDGKNIYVVWAERLSKEDSQRIFLSKSNDGGLTFSNPIDLSKSGVADFPRVVVPPYYYYYGKNNGSTSNPSTASEGLVYFAWKYETDDGKNDSINTTNSSSIDMIPRIALVKSLDGGNTFSQIVNVSPKMTMPFWDMSASQNGNQLSLYLAWENKTKNLFGLPDGIDVYFRASNDEGNNTFGNVLDLTGNNTLKALLAAQNKPLSFVTPQIASSPDGKYVYVAWQASYPDSTEIYVRASKDGGQSFGRIISLNEEQAKDPISISIAAGSSNPLFGSILAPLSLAAGGAGITIVAGIIAFMIFRSRKRT